MAVSCRVKPFGTEGDVGVTEIDTSAAVVTVSVLLPETVPTAAVITVLPMLVELASPLVPAALLTVATLVTDELHVTWVVRFWVVLSV